jgi:hypothetical protein
MSGWLGVFDLFAVILVVLLALLLGYVTYLVVRRRVLRRRGASIEMSINRSGEPTARGWVLGLGIYGVDEIEWYRTFSMSWLPHHRLQRREVNVVGTRTPDLDESYVLGEAHSIVELHTSTPVRQVAMGTASVTAFLAWLEASPPGRRGGRSV